MWLLILFHLKTFLIPKYCLLNLIHILKYQSFVAIDNFETISTFFNQMIVDNQSLLIKSFWEKYSGEVSILFVRYAVSFRVLVNLDWIWVLYSIAWKLIIGSILPNILIQHNPRPQFMQQRKFLRINNFPIVDVNNFNIAFGIFAKKPSRGKHHLWGKHNIKSDRLKAYTMIATATEIICHTKWIEIWIKHIFLSIFISDKIWYYFTLSLLCRNYLISNFFVYWELFLDLNE